MRADRLLSIVLLLQRHQRLTAVQLAENLGVTVRTIYRDIEALSMAGVPVYTRPGPDGGCFLEETYRHSLNWFTEAELQTLLFTGSASPLSDLGMDQAMDNAVLKLLTLLPKPARHAAEQMRQRLLLDPTGWYESDDTHPMLDLLKEAVWTDHILSATYRNWEGGVTRIRLAPYSLVFKSDRWYLVGKPQPRGEMRTYRVARLTEVRMEEARFEREIDFDIAVYWAAASSRFLQSIPVYPVMLRVMPHTMIYFRHTLRGRFEVLEEGEPWWVLRVNYTAFEEARTSVLGLGTAVEVLEPQALHTAVVEQAYAIVAQYGLSG